MSIFEAILTDDLEKVARLATGALRRRPSPAEQEALAARGLPETSLRLPPLLFAAAFGRVGAAEILHEAGGKIHQSLADPAEPGGRIDALLLAARNGHSAMVEFLLARGFPRHRAMKRLTEVETPTMVTLIAGGVRFDEIVYEDGGSPLMSVAMDDDLEGLRCLLAAGADPSFRDNYDDGFALSYALRHGARRTASELAAIASSELLAEAFERRAWDLRSEWEIARERGTARWVELFSDLAAPWQPRPDWSPDDLETLVESTRSFETPLRDNLGRTPLHLAAELGRRDCVLKLLEGGHPANLSASPLAGSRQTALLCAARAKEQRSAILRDLIAAGAELEQVDPFGQNALFVALDHEIPFLPGSFRRGEGDDALETLLAAGARIDARDGFGRTPLELAELGAAVDLRRAGTSYADIAERLAKAGAPQTPAAVREGHRLIAALWKKDETEALLALESGAMPDIRDPRGRPALHLALEAGYADIFSGLLESGANPNSRLHGTYGPNPLLAASFREDTWWLDQLLEHGADPWLPIDPDLPWKTTIAMVAYYGRSALAARLASTPRLG